ncbi:hypothetical protein [Kaistia defluvii]|uniref:Uncharacterized protein n=1 Tax=Kaistia defluvii TaxID=410841 RepID=A0ABV2R5K8_9HYPH
MSNVVNFPRNDSPPRHILIETGWVESQQGAGIGIRKYFVSVVEQDGGTTCVWDGTTHKDALDAAHLWELPIADMVIGGAA